MNEMPDLLLLLKSLLNENIIRDSPSYSSIMPSKYNWLSKAKRTEERGAQR